MNLEERRYRIQKTLDAEKTDKERNAMGQFSTPFKLAHEMATYALSLSSDRIIDFLEPSIGTGVFYSALRQLIDVRNALGFEIDPHYFTPTQDLWRNESIKLINDDFFNQIPHKEYNLILANPPYSRHHHISNSLKKALQQRILSEYNITLSGLAGLYCYFLILSTQWLKEDGISCWLIPSEFLDVNYGEAVKKFLCSQVELISIHRFDTSDLQFNDALVSSAVVTFRNRIPKNHEVRLSSGGSLMNPDHVKLVPLDNFVVKNKWNQLFSEELAEVEGLPLGHYFKVSRGISTGNNSFFIITRSEAERLKLPFEFLTPILPAPRNMRFTEVYRDCTNHKDNDLFLLSCPLDIEIVKNEYPTLYKYIMDGEENGANSSYNCQKRHPWYSCESRQPAPIYMTYMGRGDNCSRMFRFILNESDSIVTNSYLMLYPKDSYLYCFKNQSIHRKVWEILGNIPKNRLAQSGRSYGGGLFKIEPKELERLKVPELKDILIPQQGSLFAE